jgi:hypothetical protein
LIGAFSDRREAVADTIGVSDMACRLMRRWLACIPRYPAAQAHAAINENIHKVRSITVATLVLMVCFILQVLRYALNDAPNWTKKQRDLACCG